MAIISSLNKIISEYEPPANLNGVYRSWHVESLLNQASDLLDRCLSERRELHTLDVKKTECKLKLAASVAEAQLLTSRLDRKWHSSPVASFDAEIRTLLESYSEALVTAKNHAHNLVYEPPGPSNSKNISEYSLLAQTIKANAEAREKALQIEAMRGDTEPLTASIRAIISNVEYEKQCHAPGGTLYFDAQMNALQQRIVDDFRDAYDRLSVASQGLKHFYGYDRPLPSLTVQTNVNLLSGIDQVCLWTRAAVRWMVASAQYEHVFTFQLSARSLLNSDVWQEAMHNLMSVGETSLEFWLDPSITNYYRFCRFRGVAGFVIGSDDIWSAAVILPELAVSIQLDADGNDLHVKLDQHELPLCVLGRIENRLASREPEFGGVASLRNASPFGYEKNNSGMLTIKLIWPFGNVPASLREPEDFQFEFQMAGLPK